MKLHLSFFINPKFGQNATSCEDSYIKLYRYNACKIFENTSNGSKGIYIVTF
jgi:hypothetical protein